MRIPLAGCAAIVVIAGVLSAARVSADPSPIPVTSAAASHQADQIALLAGDSRWLVYAQIPTLGDGTGDTTTASLLADDGSGSPEMLGGLPLLDYPAQDYSLDGSILSAPSFTFVPPDSVQLIVAWWNIADHTSGTADLPSSDTYLGSSPDGWLYADGDTLYDASTAGVVRTVDAAVPFGSGSATITSGSVGPNGVVLTASNNQVTYVSFAGHAQRLAFNRQPAGYHHFAQCGGTTANETICADEPVLQVSDIRKVRQSTRLVVRELPLNGSAAASAPDSCAGTGLTYDDSDYTGTPGAISAVAIKSKLICADTYVSSRTSETAHVHRSSYRVGDGYFEGGSPILASLGHAVVTNPAHNAVETVTSATRAPRRLFAGAPSPVTVGSFALSPGRIAWAADPAAATANTTDTMSTATLSVTGGGLVKGATRRTATGVRWSFVAASGETSVYQTRTTGQGEPSWIVHVVSPYRTTEITDIKPATISLSGNRMLYLTAAEQRGTPRQYLLLNVDTGRTKRIDAFETSPDLAALAPQLWGNQILYGGTDSPLERLNLNSGHTQTLPEPAGFSPNSLYFHPLIYGHEVAWEAGGPDGEDGVIAKTTDPNHPIVLGPDNFVYALTNDGAITYPWSDTTTHSYPLSLRGYGPSDSAAPLGVDANAVSTPQLDSGVLAWRTQEYQLQAAAIPDQPLTPLYLGAPYAPHTFTLGPGNSWPFTLPYSAPLTDCQMVISHGATTVRTLRCTPSAMKLGDASGSWDGTDGVGHKAPPGAYTWTATVNGSSGATDTKTGTINVK